MVTFPSNSLLFSATAHFKSVLGTKRQETNAYVVCILKDHKLKTKVHVLWLPSKLEFHECFKFSLALWNEKLKDSRHKSSDMIQLKK